MDDPKPVKFWICPKASKCDFAAREKCKEAVVHSETKFCIKGCAAYAGIAASHSLQVAGVQATKKQVKECLIKSL